MNRVLALPFLLIFIIAPLTGSAQEMTAAERARATEISNKIKRVFLLNQLVPVLLSREQIDDMTKILEEVRAAERTMIRKEFEEMRKVEKDVDEAIKAAEARGVVPTDQTLTRLLRLQAAFTISRQAFVNAQVASVTGKIEKVLDKGQQAAAANALDPRIFDPSLDVTKLSQSERLQVWVRAVLLDPLCYPLLTELRTKMRPGQKLGSAAPKEDK
ncbi:MAG: hypothetical protein MUE84_04525 [Hyphomonas sp.]|jgi:hypothetical protein|nr:hypothetical protein [Hyphomonas sp.]